MKWVFHEDIERWHAKFDRKDPTGLVWECFVERRGGMIDELASRRSEELRPSDGPWLWAIGFPDAAGKFLLIGCGAVASAEEAIEEAENLQDEFVALARQQAELN